MTNDSLIPMADLLPLLGISTPPPPAVLAQITLAAEGVSRLVRDYTGRALTRGSYAERFHWAPTDYGVLPPDRVVALTEWPVEQVTAVEGEAGQPVQGTEWWINAALGRLHIRSAAWPRAVSHVPLVVRYVGGYDPLPADLTLLVLALIQQQLRAMGVDVAALGGTAVAGDAPVKAVTVGPLRVEYAVATSGAAAQSSSASPLTEAGMAPFRAVLDHYRSFRMFAATGA